MDRRNLLYYGDNLEWLREAGRDGIASESVDLIYLDPPFNSQRNYNLLFKQVKGEPSHAQIMAFEDTWGPSPRAFQEFMGDARNAELWKLIDTLHELLGDSEMMAYVLMMAPRLLELHRKLKPTGSLYLHYDPVASHYLKIVLDVIFGPDRFRNEIIWKRHNARSTTGRWPRMHDTLLAYSKGNQVTFHPQLVDGDPGKMPHTLITGPDGKKYQTYELTGDGRRNGETGTSWRGFDPNRMSRHWGNLHSQLDEWAEAGLIHFPKNGGFPRRRAAEPFEAENRKVTVGSVWTDVDRINQSANERRGYPTQKPLALLERILAASSNEGDVVLDPFAGCGTAVVAAERMGRRWIGIDVTYLAINEIITRLEEEKREGHALDFELRGTPKDMAGARGLFETTAAQNHKPFEQWAVTLVGARYNEKRGADRGIDGRIRLVDLQGRYREAVVQVKGGNAMNLSTVRDFANVIESEKAVLGIMLGMRGATKEMELVAEKMGFADWPGSRKYPRYQIYNIEDLLEKGVRAEVPDAYRPSADVGVGKKSGAVQAELFGEE